MDGGPAKDNFLMQFQSDILDTSLVRAEIEEISAYGSALAAGMATGIWKTKEELTTLSTTGKVFRSSMSADKRNLLYAGWKEAVKRTLSSG